MAEGIAKTDAFRGIGLRSLLAALFWLVTPATAATLNVAAGGDLQAALNDAHCGDTIVLQAGATYTTTYGFVLPYKACTGTDADYITVTTSGPLPPAGTRLDPTVYAGSLARLVAPSVNPIVSTRNLAHHWKFIGLDFSSNGNQFIPILITFGSSSVTGDEATYAQRELMKGFVIDRCFIHPPEISATSLSSPSVTRSIERGIQANVNDARIINSYIAGFTGRSPSGDSLASEAVLIDAGPGPLHVVNNYLEAWYANVFIGDSDASPLPEHTATVSNAATIGTAALSTVKDLAVGDLVSFKAAGAWEVGKVTAISGNVIRYTPQTATFQPFNTPPDMPGRAQWKGDVLHDVVIRGNTMVKRPEWGSLGQPKGWIEVKAGRHVTIEGNLMTSGTPTTIVITVRNQNGSSPWIEIMDFNFRNNKLVNFTDPGFAIQLKDNEKVTGLSGGMVIENNLLLGSPNSRAFLALGGHDIVFSHNTILSQNSLAVGAGLPTQNVTLIDNILHQGLYGIGCDGGGSACFPGLEIQGNVIVDNKSVGGLSSIYPAGNFFPSSDAAVGWVDPASGDYRLSAGSPFKGKASDGADPGVNMDELLAALGGRAPAPAPTPTSAADTTPPTMTIASPSTGATVSGTVRMSVSKTDNVLVTMNKYLVDGRIIGGFFPPSWSLSWNSKTVSDGLHTISVVAYDVAGNSSQSTVQVNVDNRPRTLPELPRYSTDPARADASAAAAPSESKRRGPPVERGKRDTTAPTTPTGLAATAVSDTKIDLGWSASTDDVAVTGYRVYRNGAFLTTLGNVTTYQDNGLAPATAYTYNVDAIDAAGNASGTSIGASATTLAPDTRVALAWDPPPSPGVVGYRIYYGTAPGKYFQALGNGVDVGNVPSFTVTGLARGTRYYFVATGYDASNDESIFSNEVFMDIP